ncbi:mycofactocin-coupled SDR family oxidoreductase [Streptomyces sp. NPDC051572]|uniref:mycofactocin-coupled SDR family oxidoreductase n=1 Tax=unclassified Streptomyces TaxID=2593676 RepID=UPI00344D6220
MSPDGTGPGCPRVAMVTGAARGIGAATVRALCAQGYGVLAVDNCAGEAAGAGVDYPLATRDDLVALAASYGDQVVPFVADVRDRDALRAAASTAMEVFGRIDAAVAAAAVIAGGHPLWETSDDQLRALVDVDLIGVWNTAAVTVPLMVAGPAPSGCRFVAIASSAGRHGLFGLSAYNAVKHGVVGLVRGLAEDLVGTGVTAVAVSPGSTHTAMLDATAQLYGLDSAEDFTGSSLIRRLLEPEEVAEAVAFCCSPQAASLNGSVLSADGGFRS